MLRRTAIAAIASTASLLGLSALPALAQSYPVRTIRLIVPFAPGGGTDYIARSIGQHLADANRWTVVVENRAGANGTLGLAEAARANPSGHDLVIGQLDNLVLAPLLTRVGFDPVADFTPVAQIARTPLIIVASARSSFRSLADVVAASRVAPGSVTLGSSGTNSASHLMTELMRVKAGVQIRHVPYRGSAPALGDLVGGHLSLVGTSIASAIALIRSGELRTLAVCGAERSPQLPDIPTLAELGIPGVEVGVWYGLLGPAGLPEDVTRRLNAEVNRIVQRSEVVAALGEQGLQPTPLSQQQFAATLRTDVERWAAMIAEIGLRRE